MIKNFEGLGFLTIQKIKKSLKKSNGKFYVFVHFWMEREVYGGVRKYQSYKLNMIELLEKAECPVFLFVDPQDTSYGRVKTLITGIDNDDKKIFILIKTELFNPKIDETKIKGGEEKVISSIKKWGGKVAYLCGETAYFVPSYSEVLPEYDQSDKLETAYEDGSIKRAGDKPPFVKKYCVGAVLKDFAERDFQIYLDDLYLYPGEVKEIKISKRKLKNT